ncbi:MAG TPA: caspase family protein, partial [Alphaproteobacteria bacterium]|nr:caspase family protein [Alphaproteobacteria bacterium]
TSEMKFTVQDGVLVGVWRTGGGYVNGKTQDFTIEIEAKGKISGYVGENLHLFRIRGTFDGESARGEIKSSQSVECVSSWQATRIERAEKTAAKLASAAADDAPPVIETPGELQTAAPVIELTGRVSDASAIIEFTVNGTAAPLQADGGFHLKRGVALGQSELVIAALDEWGNRAERRITVSRKAAASSEPAAEASATAIASDTSAPMIAVPPALETDNAIVEISGGIIDASAIVDVRVAGRSVPLGADGTFHIRRGVPVGDSELVVSALDEWGNEATKRIRITRRAPAADAAAAPRQSAALDSGTGDRQAPRIQLPADLVTENPEINIAGSVTDASAILDLFVNERPVTLRGDGSFRITRRLKTGVNKFTFSAIDEWGNRASETIDVLRKRLDLALGDYHALVIGNNDYNNLPKLNTAVADAEAVSKLLEDRYGFTVTKLINATRYDVIGAMSELRASLSYDSNLLIYYAGHGIVDPVTERGYWLPVDADQGNPANWVSNDDITDMVKAIPARHILVIADSCYSGTLVRAAPVTFETWQDSRDWLKRIVGKRSRTALASAGWSRWPMPAAAAIRCSPRHCSACCATIRKPSKPRPCSRRCAKPWS